MTNNLRPFPEQDHMSLLSLLLRLMGQENDAGIDRQYQREDPCCESSHIGSSMFSENSHPGDSLLNILDSALAISAMSADEEEGQVLGGSRPNGGESNSFGPHNLPGSSLRMVPHRHARANLNKTRHSMRMNRERRGFSQEQ